MRRKDKSAVDGRSIPRPLKNSFSNRKWKVTKIEEGKYRLQHYECEFGVIVVTNDDQSGRVLGLPSSAFNLQDTYPISPDNSVQGSWKFNPLYNFFIAPFIHQNDTKVR